MSNVRAAGESSRERQRGMVFGEAALLAEQERSSSSAWTESEMRFRRLIFMYRR